MKVLVISASFPPNPSGEATNALYLCKHFADRGLDVHVLTTQGNGNVDDRRIQVHGVMRDWSWSETARFAKFIRACSPDAILLMYIGWMYGYHPLVTFAPTICKRLLPDVRFVTRFEDPLCPSDPGRSPLLARAVRRCVKQWAGAENVSWNFGTLLRDSDRLVVLSKSHYAYLLNHSPAVESNSVLIPPPPNMRMCEESNGLARQRGRHALGVNSDSFLLAYLGYLYPSKGIETILAAFQILNQEVRNVRMALIGGSVDSKAGNPRSYAHEMRDLSMQMGIDAQLRWTGEYKWDDDEASVYLRAADVCVLPFDMGVQLNNSSFACAVAHGLPIITTRGELLDAPIVDRENVLLCPPKNPHALALAIRHVMDNADLRNRLQRGARNLYHEWYSWDKAIESTIRTFQKP